MSKKSGAGGNLYLGGYDLSGDVNALTTVRGGIGVIDGTGINSSAVERLATHRNGEIGLSVFFNDATDQAHLALRGLPTADVHLMYLPVGVVLGDVVASMVAKQVSYDPTRGNDGSLLIAVQALSTGAVVGLEWGRMGTAGKRTDTAATNGTSVDDTTVSTAFGLSAYLQVFSFTGTSVTVSLEDSANNIDFAAITGAAFTAVSAAPATQRIATATGATIRRYIRVVTTGTFTNAVFAVSWIRHTTSTL